MPKWENRAQWSIRLCDMTTSNDEVDEVIVFYHLPKSAGTTLNRILRHNYRRDEMAESGPNTQEFVAELKTWPPERLAAIRFLQGHYPWGLHEMLPQRARCFTLLRDPVERVLSHFYHAQRQPDYFLYDLIRDNNGSLPELLASGIPLMMNDGQVRLLSGVYADPPMGEVTEAMLATAIANLRACAVVGITEQFDLSLVLLQRAFGWRFIGYRPVNVGHNRPPTREISAETLEAVRHYNRMDALLYEEAQRLMAQQAADAGRTLGLRLMALNIQKKIPERWVGRLPGVY